MAARVGRAFPLVLLLLVACVPMAIDEAGARSRGIHPALDPRGTGIEDIEVASVRQETRGTVQGKAVPPGATDGTIRAYWLFIDGMTGKVTIVGQG